MVDQAKGGEGNFFDHAVRCMPGGVLLMTIAFTPLEFVVTPETTKVLALAPSAAMPPHPLIPR
jgi:hypothetical protein